MKIFIVGLGLMGASYATGLSHKGHQVFGYDSDRNVVDKAMKDRIIMGFSLDLMKESDVVILCLYPKDNIEFIKQHQSYFGRQLVTDIAGTKHDMMKEIVSYLPAGVSYISHHPMAGRETSGYDFRDPSMFKKANFLIVPSINHNPSDIHILKDLAHDLEFGKITLLSAKEHDDLIAHTSQLTHLIAVSLMISDTSPHTVFATGDSFRDLTRIAKINEEMWTELFLNNKSSLIKQTDEFIKILESLKQLIKEGKAEDIKQHLKTAKALRVKFDDHKR